MSPASYLTAPPRVAAFILALLSARTRPVSVRDGLLDRARRAPDRGRRGTAFASSAGSSSIARRSASAASSAPGSIASTCPPRRSRSSSREGRRGEERLQAATDRLAVSRAKLNVQLAAVREARAQVRRVFWFVPGI